MDRLKNMAPAASVIDDRLPSWVSWAPRPFPDANLLLLHGPRPALVDTGFVGHADDTREWAEARAGGRKPVAIKELFPGGAVRRSVLGLWTRRAVRPIGV